MRARRAATDTWPVHRSEDRARTEIISCADWRFNWHLSYTYADDDAPLLPAGTVLHVTSWFDNSSANKANPDPNAWTGFGQRTVDERARFARDYVTGQWSMSSASGAA